MEKKKWPIIIGIVLGVLVIAGLAVFIYLKQSKITITYISDNMVNTTVKVRKGEKVTLPEIKKEGFVLEGWYYNGKKTIDGTSFNDDVVLIANWIAETAKTMVITFDTDGGDKIEPSTIECETELKLPTPNKSGYKFINWLDKNETIITNETKLVCEDITLKARWEKNEEAKPSSTAPQPASSSKKEYTCPDGYTLDGTKCKMTKNPSYACPSGTTADGDLCIRTSDRNDGTRVCKEATVSIDGKGHTWTGGGDYYFIPNAYGKCAYHLWESYTTQTQCEQANDIYHKTTWVSQLDGCYAETKMNNYETVCDSNYQWYSSGDLSSKFGIHDNGKCLRKVSKEAQCESGYTLADSKCVKTIDATLK